MDLIANPSAKALMDLSNLPIQMAAAYCPFGAAMVMAANDASGWAVPPPGVATITTTATTEEEEIETTPRTEDASNTN